MPASVTGRPPHHTRNMSLYTPTGAALALGRQSAFLLQRNPGAIHVSLRPHPSRLLSALVTALARRNVDSCSSTQTMRFSMS